MAEYQARGVVHFHAVIRLDAATPDHTVQPPPAPFTLDLLEQAIRQAAARAAVPLPSIDRAARWGRQLDLRPITTGALDRSLSAEAVAGYIAKYATKATETFGTGLDRRLYHADIDHLAARHLRPHVQAIVRACWQLGGHAELQHLRLRRWAHMLGYRGHWTTRSRRYSTTFTALRAQRQAHAHAQPSLCHHDQDQAVIVLASWTYAGRGHRSEAERWLALAAAARAREHRRIAREELSSSSRAA